MTDYRCYFVDDQDHVRGVANHVVCSDDAEASRIAKTLLAERCRHVEPSRYAAVEVWDRTRKVSRQTKVYSWPLPEPGKTGTRSLAPR